LIVLSEYQVPYLGEASAGTIGLAFSFTASKLFTEVVMNLAARSTRTRIANGTPEVIFITESQYLADWHAKSPPIRKCLFIVKVNGYPKPLFGQSQVSGDKFPGPGNGFSLKIITDTEIPKHFEECEVLAIAHRIYVSGAKAFLTGS